MLIVLSFNAIAQRATTPRPDFKTVFSIGLDPKMATVGAHPNRENNTPSLDYEISFGFEWENTRLLMQVKNHKKINFFKWTYLQLDYKKELFKNVYGFTGLEIGQIKRKHPNASFDNPNNYRDVTINPIIFGANLELQYKLLDDRFGIGAQASIYQAEDELKQYKKYRKDVTLTIFFYL